ncbi:hypothetical protein NDU88_004173 [Pleurodeles waltl]|uniref:Uncharacterized protein n=1 Tax=Pleurodeles waltl TaxID=8319 RepID=A0AAV7L3X1_PLEWA|nr:hypothetical protein NDU88_004173 [Pleurodeles waltl]
MLPRWRCLAQCMALVRYCACDGATWCVRVLRVQAEVQQSAEEDSLLESLADSLPGPWDGPLRTRSAVSTDALLLCPRAVIAVMRHFSRYGSRLFAQVVSIKGHRAYCKENRPTEDHIVPDRVSVWLHRGPYEDFQNIIHWAPCKNMQLS